jgi:hypothetical protein
MAPPTPLTDPPPPVEQLLDVLTALGRPATVSATAPRSATTLHLTRLLVAVSEHHAIAAELALGIDDASEDHDVDTHQNTYDTATVRAMFERLALAHWRARCRLPGKLASWTTAELRFASWSGCRHWSSPAS